MPTYPIVGSLKIRQVSARSGAYYCVIAIPQSVMEHFGWKPGQFLSYYPTKDGSWKLYGAEALMTMREDFDVNAAPRGQDLKGPRKGGVADLMKYRDEEIEETIARLNKSFDAISSGDGEGQEDEQPARQKARPKPRSRPRRR